MLTRLWKIAKVTLLVVIALLVAGVALAYWWAQRQIAPVDYTVFRARWPAAMSYEDADRAALDLVSKMSLDEKVGQMTGAGIGPMLASMALRGTSAPVFSGRNDRLGIPPVAFTDGPRGVITGFSTSFPVAIARAATWDLDLQRRVGDAIGKEARAQGANYWGGLCLNIVRHPSMGRAEETFGEDPWLTGEMGVAILEAVQRHNVMACAKHFALNSMETARFKNNVTIDERTLREVYLPHFQKAVAHDVATFMSAYNKVRGEWAGENRYLLTTVLRDDWGFRGFVTSDWIWGLHDGKRGVAAGLDIEMPMARVYGANLTSLAQRGEVPVSEVDESVRRIVRTKLLYLTRRDPEASYPLSLAAAAPHTALAREVAEKAMVLLKNDGGLLPLDKARTKTIAVVGHLADAANTGDRGSSNVTPPYTTSALKGLRDYLGDGATVLHANGDSLDEVTRVATGADAVIVIAGTRWDEVGEYITDDAGLRPKDASEKHPMRISFRSWIRS
jgi:beta-glucosidase